VSQPASYRQPRSVIPERYVLELAPDIDAATFAGMVSIDIKIT
jgi:hypothetical protein